MQLRWRWESGRNRDRSLLSREITPAPILLLDVGFMSLLKSKMDTSFVILGNLH